MFETTPVRPSDFPSVCLSICQTVCLCMSVFLSNIASLRKKEHGQIEEGNQWAMHTRRASFPRASSRPTNSIHVFFITFKIKLPDSICKEMIVNQSVLRNDRKSICSRD